MDRPAGQRSRPGPRIKQERELLWLRSICKSPPPGRPPAGAPGAPRPGRPGQGHGHVVRGLQEPGVVPGEPQVRGRRRAPGVRARRSQGPLRAGGRGQGARRVGVQARAEAD